jgi:hypothetical protein
MATPTILREIEKRLRRLRQRREDSMEQIDRNVDPGAAATQSSDDRAADRHGSPADEGGQG